MRTKTHPALSVFAHIGFAPWCYLSLKSNAGLGVEFVAASRSSRRDVARTAAARNQTLLPSHPTATLSTKLSCDTFLFLYGIFPLLNFPALTFKNRDLLSAALLPFYLHALLGRDEAPRAIRHTPLPPENDVEMEKKLPGFILLYIDVMEAAAAEPLRQTLTAPVCTRRQVK